MEIKDLLKRISDACNYNEMIIDTELTIDFICEITAPLVQKDVIAVNDAVIEPLMKLYRDAENKEEMSFIRDTIFSVIEYIAK